MELMKLLMAPDVKAYIINSYFWYWRAFWRYSKYFESDKISHI